MKQTLTGKHQFRIYYMSVIEVDADSAAEARAFYGARGYDVRHVEFVPPIESKEPPTGFPPTDVPARS